MEKMKLETPDITQENIAKIKALFPSCVIESTDSEGRLKKMIDFDKLKLELGDAIVEGKKERYQFTWPMKSVASALANTPTSMTLRPDVEASKDFWNTENLYIEGDNLEVLKVLRETYLGKVKMIYIDPPYNTGKDFVYKDRRYLSQKEMDELEGRYDEYGNIYRTNTESNGRFHTDWLNMIYPRLKVARDLLTDDGVIFISIDDSEQESLKKICDEIFGEQNFISQVVWERSFAPINLKKHFSVSHDYIIGYAKNLDDVICNGLPRTEESNGRYINPDNDPRGVWQSDNSTVGPAIPDKVYELTTPGGKTYLPPNGRCWLYTKERFQEMIEDNRIWFGEDGNNMPRVKRFLAEVKQGITPMSIWKHEEVGHSQDASQKLKKLFNGKSYFEYPKPIGLIKRLIQLYTNQNCLVLDFFSGSGTTAHAVFEQNIENGDDIKFIMVQLPEIIDKECDATKDGYKNICEIGEERIRRAGEKIKEEYGEKAKDLDIGFRVLKLDSSNMKDVKIIPNALPGLNLDDLTDNIKEDRDDLDLLFQIMLHNNIPLSAKIDKENINGHVVYNVGEDDLIAVFDRTIDEDTLVEIAKKEPLKFVMREPIAQECSDFNPDNIIDNFEQKFELYSPNTIRRIL